MKIRDKWDRWLIGMRKVTTVPKIAPCPFCKNGSENLMVYEVVEFIYAVNCVSCGTIGPSNGFTADRKEAIRRWNKCNASFDTSTTLADLRKLQLDAVRKTSAHIEDFQRMTGLNLKVFNKIKERVNAE